MWKSPESRRRTRGFRKSVPVTGEDIVLLANTFAGAQKKYGFVPETKKIEVKNSLQEAGLNETAIARVLELAESKIDALKCGTANGKKPRAKYTESGALYEPLFKPRR